MNILVIKPPYPIIGKKYPIEKIIAKTLMAHNAQSVLCAITWFFNSSNFDCDLDVEFVVSPSLIFYDIRYHF